MPVNKDFYPIAGSSGAQSTGYTIDQSIRFNDGDNPKLTRTPSSAGNRRTFTFSSWIKRGILTTHQTVFGSYINTTNYFMIYFDLDSHSSDNTFRVYEYNGNVLKLWVYGTQRFRDTSAWYHFVVNVDTTNPIANERVKMYVNGSRITDLTQNQQPALNYETYINSTNLQTIGEFYGNYYHLDAYMADIHLVDGYAYGPEFFGEFDDYDNWIPKEYTGSYGTNGFKIDGRDSSDLGDDESGNGNDYTSSGLAAHDQVTDTPTNNFCVMNPLANPGGSTYAEGNLKVTMASGTKKGTYSSFAIDSGKWYVEGRLTSNNNGSEYAYTGIEDYNSAIGSGQYIGRDTYGYSYDPANGAFLHNNSNVVSSLPSVAQGDIIQIAVDLDNNAIYWGKNGTFLNSGNPASGASKTGGVSIIAASSQPSGHYHIGHSNGTGSSGYQSEIVWNFGQDGTFAGGTTAGGNSDGNGIGNFKYSVPSGYLALCTQNLFGSGG